MDDALRPLRMPLAMPVLGLPTSRRTFGFANRVFGCFGGFFCFRLGLLAEERVNSEGRLGWGEGNPGE